LVVRADDDATTAFAVEQSFVDVLVLDEAWHRRGFAPGGFGRDVPPDAGEEGGRFAISIGGNVRRRGGDGDLGGRRPRRRPGRGGRITLYRCGDMVGSAALAGGGAGCPCGRGSLFFMIFLHLNSVPLSLSTPPRGCTN
jgi:hypothetical protein